MFNDQSGVTIVPRIETVQLYNEWEKLERKKSNGWLSKVTCDRFIT